MLLIIKLIRMNIFDFLKHCNEVYVIFVLFYVICLCLFNSLFLCKFFCCFLFCYIFLSYFDKLRLK